VSSNIRPPIPIPRWLLVLQTLIRWNVPLIPLVTNPQSFAVETQNAEQQFPSLNVSVGFIISQTPNKFYLSLFPLFDSFLPRIWRCLDDWLQTGTSTFSHVSSPHLTLFARACTNFNFSNGTHFLRRLASLISKSYGRIWSHRKGPRSKAPHSLTCKPSVCRRTCHGLSEMSGILSSSVLPTKIPWTELWKRTKTSWIMLKPALVPQDSSSKGLRELVSALPYFRCCFSLFSHPLTTPWSHAPF